jgi:hypothetical protein
MHILHIAGNTNGYEEVELLANRIDRTNSFALIKKKGQKFMTGGFLLNDTPEIRALLDAIPREKQYEFVRSFKCDPFVKAYAKEG